MKEVSLVLGALAQRTPARLLPPRALQAAGAALVDVLLRTKHNGAVDKARQGLTQLAARLLREEHGSCAVGDDSPAAAPAAWAAQLLARLGDTSQGVRDLIRRSAGLPFALLALCLAEPAGVQRSILPDVLAGALGAARAATALQAGDARYVPGVHGFNTLRVLFSDHALAADTAGALPDGVAAALDGFASPHWALRNAAGLAFAALCVRTTGVLNAPAVRDAAPGGAGGAGAPRGSARCLTAPEFFARFPALHAVMTAQLDAAQDAAAAAHGGLHPGLQPVLALLSRLRPAAAARARAPGEEVPGPDAATFVPRVRAAGASRHATVRALAARALVPLVQRSDAAALAASLLAALPDGPRSEHPAAWGGGAGLQCSYNALHGALLQAAALVRSAGCAAADAPPLLAQLCRLAWLAEPQRCAPPAVRAQYVDALRALASASPDAAEDGALWSLLVRAAACAASGDGGGGPGEALWRKQCALAAVAVALRDASASPAAQRHATSVLLTRLSARAYEVRGAVLKALQRAHAAGGLTLDAPMLRAGLRTALAAEAHHKCSARMLELLSALPPAAASDASVDVEVWRVVDAAAGAARDARQRAAALRCLGVEVAALPRDGSAAAEACASLLCRVDASSDYATHAEERAAAAHALAASRLLCGGGDAQLQLRAWMLALRLLEDEEADVRDVAAAAVAAALPGGGARTAAGADAMLPAAVAHAARAHGDAPALHAWLLAAVAGSAPGAALRTGADLVRRLFDREVDNHHAEALLTAQLAARELARLGGAAALPAATLAAAATALGSAAKDAAPRLARLQRRACWAGGVTNHSDAFLAVYRLLLAEWALAPALAGAAADNADVASAAARLGDGVAALAAQLAGMTPHPLARDMLLCVVDALLAARVPLSACSDDGGALAALREERDRLFEPLFLLS
jgi:hypothetical protein